MNKSVAADSIIGVILVLLVIGLAMVITYGTPSAPPGEVPAAREFCYRGVVYVWFWPDSQSGWGTVRLDRDTGNVIQCGPTAKGVK